MTWLCECLRANVAALRARIETLRLKDRVDWQPYAEMANGRPSIVGRGWLFSHRSASPSGSPRTKRWGADAGPSQVVGGLAVPIEPTDVASPTAGAMERLFTDDGLATKLIARGLSPH